SMSAAKPYSSSKSMLQSATQMASRAIGSDDQATVEQRKEDLQFAIVTVARSLISIQSISKNAEFFNILHEVFAIDSGEPFELKAPLTSSMFANLLADPDKLKNWSTLENFNLD